jgi:FAD/FMN-containing dehydrogenase
MPDTQNCKSGKTFKNWAETIEFKPRSYCHPDDGAAVLRIIEQAAQGQQHVRVQGNGHSWSQFIQTQDHLIQLDRLGDGLTANADLQVVMHAGIKLKRLVEGLRRLDPPLGLANTGSILEQSIAGAISTGTHGTGRTLGNFATQVTGLTLVTMKGGSPTVLSLPEQGADYFKAAKVSMGALGVITQVTLQCVTDYDVELKAYKTSFADIAKQRVIDELNATNQRLRLWWFRPKLAGAEVIVTTMKDIPEGHDATPPEALIAFLEFLADGTKAKPLTLRGHYSKLLTLPLEEMKHRECEYAIPIDRTAEALNALHEIMEEGDFTTNLPTEVRFVQADDILLSPANGRDVCYIGINTKAHNEDPSANELFARFEPLMKQFGGRPHWGKHFTLTPQELEQMYGENYTTFKRIRAELDPTGLFENSLIRNLFPHPK